MEPLWASWYWKTCSSWWITYAALLVWELHHHEYDVASVFPQRNTYNKSHTHRTWCRRMESCHCPNGMMEDIAVSHKSISRGESHEDTGWLFLRVPPLPEWWVAQGGSSTVLLLDMETNAKQVLAAHRDHKICSNFPSINKSLHYSDQLEFQQHL